jgi:hypothetical protein
LRTGIDAKMIQISANRNNSITMSFWKDAVDDYVDIAYAIDINKPLSDNELIRILSSLLQIYGYLIEFNRQITSHGKRKMVLMSDKVAKLFRNIEERNIASSQAIKEKMLELISDLQSIF